MVRTRVTEEKGEESVKSSDQFSKYAAVTMFLNYHYYHRATTRAKRVRKPLATVTIITALSYELLISRDRVAALRALDDGGDSRRLAYFCVSY